jgi:hypothetical protein
MTSAPDPRVARLLTEAADFVKEIHDFKCVRPQEEGDSPFNIVDYSTMENLEADLRTALAYPGFSAPEASMKHGTPWAVEYDDANKGWWVQHEQGAYVPVGGPFKRRRDAVNQCKALNALSAVDAPAGRLDGEPLLRVTRVEVIDHRRGAPEPGRVFSAWDASVELSYQDAGRTVKVFVTDGVAAQQEQP